MTTTWWLLFVAIGATALTLRLAYLREIRVAPFVTVLMGDAKSYDAWAQRIAAGDWIGHDVFYQAPLYPYFLGVVYRLFGHDIAIVRVIQSCLGSLSCLLLAHAASRLFTRRAGLVAGLLLAVYAPAIFFDGLIQKTALDAFLTCVAVWLLSDLIVRHARWPVWTALGVTLAALSLTRENALLLAAVIGAWTLWPRPAGGTAVPTWSERLITRALPYVAGLALLLLPVAARNAWVGGGFYLTTSQFGPNLYLGNNPATDGTAGSLIAGRGAAEYERQDAIDIAERDAGRTLSPAEVSSYWTARTLGYIRSQPGDWLRLMVRKTALLWNDAEAFDTESQESYSEYSPILATLSTVGRFGVLVPLALCGVVVSWPNRRRLWILYALIATYAVSVIIFFIYARYRFPLVPMLLPFAAAALTEGIGVLRDSTWRTRGTLAAATMGVVVLVCWPLLDRRDMRAVTEHNLGAALQSEGRLDEAVLHYRKAIADKPDYVPAYSNLGATLLARGDSEGAITAYRRALEIDPNFADARFNYGNALMERHDVNGAIEQFQLALKLTPGAVDVRTNLGLALLDAGRTDEGIRELEAATRAAPNSPISWRALGEALAASGKADAAIPPLRTAVALAPDAAEAHYALGRALLQSGNTADGIAELRSALSHPPVPADVYNDLGIALASSGQLQEAERWLEEAVRTQPNSEAARRNLGLVRADLTRQRPR